MRRLALFTLVTLATLGCVSSGKMSGTDQDQDDDVGELKDIKIVYSDWCSTPGSEFTQITITVKTNAACRYKKSTGQAASRNEYSTPESQFQSKVFSQAAREFAAKMQRLDESQRSSSPKPGGRAKHIWVTLGDREFRTVAEGDHRQPAGYRQFMALVEQAVQESK